MTSSYWAIGLSLALAVWAAASSVPTGAGRVRQDLCSRLAAGQGSGVRTRAATPTAADVAGAAAYIVVLQRGGGDTVEMASHLAQQHGIIVRGLVSDLGAIAADIPLERMEAVCADPRVRGVTENLVMNIDDPGPSPTATLTPTMPATHEPT